MVQIELGMQEILSHIKKVEAENAQRRETEAMIEAIRMTPRW